MTATLPPWTERDRLAALARYDILDTPGEPEYDNIVALLAEALNMPMAIINLVADGRQWFKSEIGLGVRETPLETSFCAHTIQQPGALIIPDTLADSQFSCNPLVTGEPGVRFYAGEPLETPEGLPLGALCVLDTTPHPEGLTTQQRFILKMLSQQVMTQLELRRSVLEREAALAQQYRREMVQQQIQDSALDHAIISIDLQGTIVGWNAGAANIFGWDKKEAIGQPMSLFFTPGDNVGGRPSIERRCALDTGRSNDERWHIRKDGRRFWASGELTRLLDETGAVTGFVKILRDQTDRHLMEQALRASEKTARETAERYALILTAGTILGSWMMDFRTGIYTGDASLATALHLDPETLTTGVRLEAVLPAVHPEDRSRLGILQPEMLAHGGPYRSEYRLLDNHGGWRWAETNGRIEHDANGHPLRAFGVVIDIHGRKLDELRQAALIALGDRFRNADSADAIALAAAETIGLMLDADRTGYARIDRISNLITIDRDWTNGTVPSIVGVHSLAAFRRLIANMGAGTSLVINNIEEEPWLKEDAANLRAMHIGSLVNVPLMIRGQLIGTAFAHSRMPRTWLEQDAAFVHDIADRTWAAISRVEAEMALTQAAIDLERLVAERTRERNLVWQASQDLFVICGIDGFYRSVNPAWKEALGYTSDELIGTRFDMLLHPDDVSSSREVFEQIVAGRTKKLEDIRLRHKNGDYRWYSWYAVPDNNGLFYAAGRDITERRELEMQLRHSQKMEAIGQLTGGIAHDFNNLLHGMLGNLELLQFKLAADQKADVDRHIQSAIAGAKRSAALTHRLLAFSRQQTLDPKPTDVNVLIVSMEELIARTIDPAIVFQTVLVPNVWLSLCDPNQLENALLNLVINARDALSDGGRISIETSNVVLDEHYTQLHAELLPGEYVRISVTDNGTGMTSEIVSRAIDPFFTTKPIGQGTGLGLSMIYGFVKQSGGHLRLYSELGQGTTVQIYLPRHAGEHSADTDKEAPFLLAAETAATILLVEDEEIVRTLLTEIIEGLGYSVIAVPNGKEAWGMLQILQPFDLLVTDIGLPGDMNGKQLAEAAKELMPDLKILFITGFAEQSVFGNGVRAPGIEILTKPFAMNVLADKIGNMLKTGLESK